MSDKHDIAVLRELAQKYSDLAAKPIQQERRNLWSDHNSLLGNNVPVIVNYGMHNVWCREVFGDDKMLCRDEFFRGYERQLRMLIFHDTIGDDFILEPWITVSATQERGWFNLFGLETRHAGPSIESGAWIAEQVIKDWSDVDKLSHPPHNIDEKAIARNVQHLGDAIGDIVTINVGRGPACIGFMSDISTHLAMIRGLEQVMMDMYDFPEQLKGLLAFMRDGILSNQAAAESAGDYSLTSQANQCMTYCNELDPPAPNTPGKKRKDIWGYCASQEFTLISPAMHDEFMLQYQKPIMENFGLSAYGCCEDLTNKIDILRKVSNLRIIAISPVADIARCAEQIGRDYVMSWRPNPADMVCCGYDEDKIRGIISHGLDVTRGCVPYIILKDIETVEGDTSRLPRWVKLVRSEVAKAGRG